MHSLTKMKLKPLSTRMLIIPLMLILTSCLSTGKKKAEGLPYILSMVNDNPGEEPTRTSFKDPQKLKDYGYNGIILNDFKFVQACITFDSFDSTIFPEGSESRRWVLQAASELKKKITRYHAAGLKVYCFTDIIVLPKKLVEKYSDRICDSTGKVTFEKPFTSELHRIMLREIFSTFPGLDGLVVRTGETYLFNVPYHTGNNPITQGPESHIRIISILRDEVCEKLNKTVIYRTWDFGNFHTKPEYYLEVTNHIKPHKNLIFSIKHTKGDFHRTFLFNPTLGIGQHRQIVEVECQREYEGKGAHPDYVMKGVIDGFEEYDGLEGPKCLNDIRDNPLLAGVYAWPRGGGWVGPYLQNELWCNLNAYVIAAWARDPERKEEKIFDDFSKSLEMSPEDRSRFRKLCLLSSKGVLIGHNSLIHPVNVWWTRDQFLGGLDVLGKSFKEIMDLGLTDSILAEKQECVDIWKEIDDLARKIHINDPGTDQYLKVSCRYGLIKYSIIQQAWIIMLRGMEGDRNGNYDKASIQSAIRKYDGLWVEFHSLRKENPSCATLYQPYSFVFEPPVFHGEKGMDESVNKYRAILSNGS